MFSNILLCCDLDRTLLPNGLQPESPMARPLLRAIARRPILKLAYVSGRHLALLESAIEEYALPQPDYLIGDVGTSIYSFSAGHWTPNDVWMAQLDAEWGKASIDKLKDAIGVFDRVVLQEPEKQGPFKLSYYVPSDIDRSLLSKDIKQCLEKLNLEAELVWSLDEVNNIGLLDILPPGSGKLQAIEFLVQQTGIPNNFVVFAGDSGNDLPVLSSNIQSVLVANAHDRVREELENMQQHEGLDGKLYYAVGGLLGMNGNYTAGVLEGLVHFIPHTMSWLESAVDDLPASFNKTDNK